MEGQFITKNIKPTLSEPTPQGKQLDTNFKKEIRKTGMNLKEEKGDKNSLKKKIFKLDKMETLVHSDEFLSQKFNELKGDDPEIIWGYHWNEVVLNSLFNEYVLNSPRYLNKYKNTRAKQKTRRGEEGIKQLQNDLEKERAASQGAELKSKELMARAKSAEEDKKEKVDEFFGFGNKGLDTELPMNKRSKNDSYLVDMSKKKLIAPVPYNATPEEKEKIIRQHLSNPNVKQISWYNAVKQGIKGVPTEVPDGSIEQMDAEFAKKYPQGIENIVSLAEDIERELHDRTAKLNSVQETTGAAGAGAFAPALDMEKKDVSETTTSAASGQYSGKAIWSKTGKPAANKPLWKGGQIVGESVINGHENYLTESTPFKNYILKNRIIDMINECEEIGEAETFQQHSERMLAKLQKYADETPELKDDKDFQELLSITAQRAGKESQKRVQTTTQPIQTNVSEHHLHSVEDKIDFITQNNPLYNAEQLTSLSQEEVDAIYRETEKLMGIAENSVREGLFSSSKNWTVDQIKSVIDNFKQSPETNEFRDQFVKAKDFIKLKTGNGIVRMPQLKMWLDKNMPQLSNYVALLWGNWDLAPTSQLKENKGTMIINKDEYKSYLKKRITESAHIYKTLNESEKKAMLEVFHEDFINESMIDPQPDSMINNQETSMAKSMESDELNNTGQPAASGAGIQGEAYDVDDLKGKGGNIADRLADYSDEEQPVDNNDDDIDEPASPAAPKADTAFGGDRESPETISDAEKFRSMLKAKYGVDSVAELSPMQRQELMKSMNFGSTEREKSSVDMDFSQFRANDAQKAEYNARDEKRLNFIAQNANRINDLKSYYAIANEFKSETGENMFHPMSILASIDQMPKGSPQRERLANVEKVLKTQMNKKIAESINEDRKVSAIINVEKLGAENAKNFKNDSANADGLNQEETYPRDENSIQKAPIYPNPKNFYIEQDLEKVQNEAPTMASIEKAALEKHKGALDNVGNATANGKDIPKRNLTKEEQTELAMNRGLGMSDIVYDNKPSEKFEERMKQDMGEEIYEIRNKKMEYRADAPTYNKDTQPVDDGEKKEQYNKFKLGYNNESITGKYKDDFGKVKLIEFTVSDVEEVTTIAEGAVKISVDGLGNKYNIHGKKINENVEFKELVDKFAFYLVENKVVAIEKSKVIVETKMTMKKNLSESFNKMKHLMNYNAKDFVDTKKSVKY